MTPAMINSNDLKDKGYRTIIISSCPVDDCSQCVSSYINEILECQLLCKCRCHSKFNDPSITNEVAERGLGVSLAHKKIRNNAGEAEVDMEEAPYLAKSFDQKCR